MISQFGFVLLFFLAALLLVVLVLGVSWLLRPSRPNPEKNAVYESGEETEGTAHVSFNIRFYIVALVFLLFEVELVLLFPWATVFGDARLIEETNGLWAVYAGVEMLIFVLILALGLMYAWKKGHLDWITPQQKELRYKSPVSEDMYRKLNEKY
ncbi:MAG: NADH-quinone oxidoreductase subunit A [Spirosomataceae bacterium]|jgi:NADH-quinone oxidoreductase subunit A